MALLSGRPSLWFGDGAKDYLFYPFGANSAGYFVARQRRRRIVRWVCWRGRLLSILWILSIVPVVDFWAPSFSVSRKLGLEILFVAIALLTAATWAVAWIADRAVFACLLSGCPTVDRSPTRMEREKCFAQVGISPRNLHLAFFSVWPLCLAAAALTIAIGLDKSDRVMAASGAVLFGISAQSVTKRSASVKQEASSFRE
jgi:hypothetical protein